MDFKHNLHDYAKVADIDADVLHHYACEVSWLRETSIRTVPPAEGLTREKTDTVAYTYYGAVAALLKTMRDRGVTHMPVYGEPVVKKAGAFI